MGNSYFTSEGSETGVVYRKIDGKIRNFVTFITNDFTAEPEI